MKWTDLQVIDSRRIATPLNAGGDLSLCPDGMVAIALGSEHLDPASYADGVWVSTAPMTETVKELDAERMVSATRDRADLLVVDFPVVAPGALLRALSCASPDDLLRELVSGEREVRLLAADPVDT